MAIGVRIALYETPRETAGYESAEAVDGFPAHHGRSQSLELAPVTVSHAACNRGARLRSSKLDDSRTAQC